MNNSVLPLQLTIGWPLPDAASLPAKLLHSKARAKSSKHSSYEDELNKQLQENNSADTIQVDQLLRRRAGGFSDINTFTGALLNIWQELPDYKSCSLDLFAFAFLKHAKNYDLFMRPQPDKQLQTTVKEWQRAVDALENFERLGLDLAPEFSHLKGLYLRLRTVTSRPSARDEQQTLAVLLVCGPLTRDEISKDLGLNYSLNKRIIVSLQKTKAIGTRCDGDTTHYFINKPALPVCLFLVRETIGLDLLTMVTDIQECG